MRLFNFLIGLGALIGIGSCRHGILLPADAESWLFSPDEKRVFFFGSTRYLSAVDIESRRVLWQRPPGVENWVALADGGGRIAVVGKRDASTPAKLSVLRTDDGKTLYENGSAYASYYGNAPGQIVALSTDGTWVAWNFGDSAVMTERVGDTARETRSPDDLALPPENADLLPPDDSQPLQEPRYFTLRDEAHPARPEQLAFDRRSLRLAVRWRGSPPRIDVYEPGDVLPKTTEAKWRRLQSWEHAYGFQWTLRGLGLLAQDGFHLVDGKSDRVLLHEDYRGSSYYESVNGWRFSNDGAWLLRWEKKRLRVIDTTSGEAVLTHEWASARDGLCDNAFSGDRLRVFTNGGLLFEFNLSTRRLTRQEDFGPPVTYHPASHFGPASESRNYDAGLSPSGGFIVLRKESGAVTLYR